MRWRMAGYGESKHWRAFQTRLERERPGYLAAVERAAGGNLKPVWAPTHRDWTGPQAQGEVFLRHATQAKTIWLPYGALPEGTGSAAY